jgi:hypothetical protein
LKFIDIVNLPTRISLKKAQATDVILPDLIEDAGPLAFLALGTSTDHDELSDLLVYRHLTQLPLYPV